MPPEALPLLPWRQCNYTCKFCFHTAISSFFLPKSEEGMEEAKECLRKLKDAGRAGVASVFSFLEQWNGGESEVQMVGLHGFDDAWLAEVFPLRRL